MILTQSQIHIYKQAEIRDLIHEPIEVVIVDINKEGMDSGTIDWLFE